MFKADSMGSTAMEIAEWRRDHQSEWSMTSMMDLDPDPGAYFAAFKHWIDTLRAASITSAYGVERNGARTAAKLTENDLQQRVPGSFPQ